MSIIDYLGNVADPRTKEHKILHKLSDILFMSIAAVICGAEDWYEIEDYARDKEAWLRTILELPAGIPSHDTFNRIFSILDSKALEANFIEWVESVADLSEGRIVSIDGKRLCNSGEHGSKAVIHMVSAWCNTNQMVLGQLKVNDKSNEITAIPALLETLMLQGCVVTLDAMGCQKEIASKIVQQGADYILAVKDNQKHLHDDIKEGFEQNKITDMAEDLQKNHGRIEKRVCRIIRDTDWVCSKNDWTNLKTLIEITATRTITATGATETQTRHYISSLAGTADYFNKAIRKHWSIENNLHWVLDVCFGEDKSTKRAGEAAVNFSCLTKIALNLLYQSKAMNGARKLPMKRKRTKADRDHNYLLSLFNFKSNF
jgi:predicted transposase YbfD/YdcC